MTYRVRNIDRFSAVGKAGRWSDGVSFTLTLACDSVSLYSSWTLNIKERAARISRGLPCLSSHDPTLNFPWTTVNHLHLRDLFLSFLLFHFSFSLLSREERTLFCFSFLRKIEANWKDSGFAVCLVRCGFVIVPLNFEILYIRNIYSNIRIFEKNISQIIIIRNKIYEERI